MKTELDLVQIFQAIRKNWLAIVVSAIVLGAAAFLWSTYKITPLYNASASLYVFGNRNSDTVTSSELSVSQRLVQTYIVVLTSNSVLDEVSRQLDGAYSASQIRDMMSASAIDGTEAFRIVVSHSDPAAAQQIVNKIADVAPAEIIRVVKAGSVEVIDYATLPTSPASPNIKRNTVIGILIGIVLMAVWVVLQDLMDNAVYTEETLTQTFSYPVLGLIPDIADTEHTEGYGSNGKE